MNDKKLISNLTFRLDAQYRRAGQKVYLCECRREFVHATPEERVRQAFIIFLRDHAGVPGDMLLAEDAMSHHKKSARGRTDIIGFALKNEEEKPLFIVECKSPETSLTDDVFEQAEKYAEVADCGIIILTNGNETEVYINDEEEWTPATGIPTYREMVDIKNYNYAEEEVEPWRRFPYKKLSSKEAIDDLLKYDCAGEGSPKENLPFYANLIGLLHDNSDSPSLPIKHRRFTILEDDGRRCTTFGNAAGGDWTGDYRRFIIADKKGDNQIISITLIGKMLAKNHPKFGNMKGNTQLNVAIDDFDKKHNSLQLNLDKFVEKHGALALIRHNGTMTVGNMGAVSPALVRQYVKKHAPHLICDDGDDEYILLGKLPTHKFINWQDAEHFLINCVEYALLRDEYRKIHRETNHGQPGN